MLEESTTSSVDKSTAVQLSLNELASVVLNSSIPADAVFTGKVIIVGAGAAGLAAAYLLHEKGVECVVLEASGRYGGRLKKLEGFADFPLDVGAEWLHGRSSLVAKLVTDTHTQIYEERSKMFYWLENQIRSDLPDRDVQTLTRVRDAPDVSFKDYARQQGWADKYDHILESFASGAGGSAENVSACWTFQEYARTGTDHVDYRFQKTYFDLIDEHIALPIRHLIRLNTSVRQIDYRGHQIVLTDHHGHVHHADRVIITVPISILQGNDIDFVPPLPADKIHAFHLIGMEAGMKVFMKFSSKFFNADFIMGCPVAGLYYDETHGKQTNDHILQAHIVGKYAQRLTDLGSDRAIVRALLEELDTMYGGQASSTFLAAHVENWTKEPFIRGAYSYSKVGGNKARQIAAQDVDNKLFFAGEAMNTNLRIRTIYGAIETGLLAVINLFNSSK